MPQAMTSHEQIIALGDARQALLDHPRQQLLIDACERVNRAALHPRIGVRIGSHPLNACRDVVTDE